MNLNTPMKFFCYEIVSCLCGLLSDFVWNTYIMSGLILQTARWIHWISYRNGYMYDCWFYNCCFP